MLTKLPIKIIGMKKKKERTVNARIPNRNEKFKVFFSVQFLFSKSFHRVSRARWWRSVKRRSRKVERRMERRRDEDTPVTKLDNKIKPIDSRVTRVTRARVLAWIILTIEAALASCSIRRKIQPSFFSTLIVKSDT